MAESHIRIDEGIKRGPRRKASPRVPEVRIKEGHEYHPAKLVGIDPKDILLRFLNGETTQRIADSLKVTRQGLAYFLRHTAENEWKDAQIIEAVERKQMAEDGIANATDALELAKAREQLRSAQWDLERLLSRLFGQKQEVVIDHRVSIDSALQESARALLDKVRGRTIDAVRVDNEVKE